MAAPALHLFDGPYVVIGGRRREVPEGSKRLLVLVALDGAHVERRAAAGTLWPIGNDVRAAGNLRSALWRLRGAGIDLIEADKHALRLTSGAAVDVRAASARATRLIEGHPLDGDLDLVAWRSGERELLPGWYEDWVVFERERLRQRMLHGLEDLGRHLMRAGRCAEAVEVALSVVAADPLRESAHRVLVEAHLAEGNVVEARRTYDFYSAVIARELGVCPSAGMIALVRAASRPAPAITAVPADRRLRVPPGTGDARLSGTARILDSAPAPRCEASTSSADLHRR